VFCYHLKGWIKNDSCVDPDTRGEVEPYVESEESLSLVGDIANGVKHLRRNRPARIDDSMRIIANESPGGYEIVIVGGDQTRTAIAIASECMTAWKNFLIRRGLLR
jgi:hypothetical protein